jgi:hypothetical protein
MSGFERHRSSARQPGAAMNRPIKMQWFAKVCAAAAVGAMVAAVTLFAGEPWNSKDPSAWTRQDIERLLTASPWVQQAGATFSLAAEDPSQAPPPTPPDAQAGLGGPVNTGPRWDGGVGRSKGPDPTLNVLIRWDSARPVREALQRSSADLDQKDVAEHAATDYIISIVGLVPAGRYRSVGRPASDSRSDDSDDSRNVDARNPEEMLESLMSASRLVPKGKPGFSPEDAKLDAVTGTLHIFFPRTNPITAADKEVTFMTRYGALTIQKRFRLKDMSYHGNLEL